MVYVPNRIVTRRIFTVIARTSGDPAAVLPSVRDAIRSVERDQPITEMGTMRDAIGDAVAAPRVLTLLVGAFGVVALLLAAIGVYGVVAYVVGQRTNEIGIRIALGARSADIVQWTLKTGLTPALVGLVVGTAGALALSRLLGAQLYEVSPTDPVVFAGGGGRAGRWSRCWRRASQLVARRGSIRRWRSGRSNCHRRAYSEATLCDVIVASPATNCSQKVPRRWRSSGVTVGNEACCLPMGVDGGQIPASRRSTPHRLAGRHACAIESPSL